MSPLLTFILFVAAFQAGPGASITGRVADAAGIRMADVEVQAINVETGVRSFAQSNEEGLYKIANLPPGIYRIVLQKHGFRSVIKPGVELRVQDIVALNFELRIGSTAESVTEVEGASPLQAETATLTQTIDRKMTAELPTLTRNPHDFVGLSAGAVPVLDRTGGGVGFAVNGQRSESANFLIDGGDSNTNPATTRPGQMLPYDSVREYRILTNSFTADYGHNAGFISNLVTRSGANEVHGTLHYSVLNSALAANSFENNAYGKRKAVFNRQQVAESFGGPIVADKAFIFGAIESIMVRSFETRTFSVPTPELLSISSPATQAIFSKYPPPPNLSHKRDVVFITPYGGGAARTVLATATVSRESPLAADAGPPQNTHLGLLRVDYSPGSRTTLTARYAFQHGNQFAPASQAYSPELDQPLLIRHHNATISMTRSWSDSILIESRFAFSRLSTTRPETGPNPNLGYGFADGSIWELGLSQSQLILPNGLTRTGGPRNSYQVHQIISWVRGKHDFKFGGQIAHYLDSIVDQKLFGNISSISPLSSAQSFVDGLYPILRLGFDFLDEPLHPDRFEEHIYSPNRSWHLRYNDAAWFVQDTWKISRRVTLTPGLRWEYFGAQYSPSRERSRDVNFYPGEGETYYERFANGKFLRTIDAPGEYRDHFIRPDDNNFGPRLGLALDLMGNGTTIMRAGGGVFYDSSLGRVPPTVHGWDTFSDVPFSGSSPLTGSSFEVLRERFLPYVERVDPDRRTSYSSAWNATIERDFGGKVVLSGSYVGSAGSNLELAVLENGKGSGRYVGRPGERILSSYSYFLTINGLAHSSYHSLQLKAEGQNRPLGLQFGASYTWGHSIDNASDRGLSVDRDTGSAVFGDTFRSIGLGVLADPTNLRLDRGNSVFDQRHRVVAHAIWQIPELPIRSALLSHLTRGWQVSGILSFQTGLPLELRDVGGQEDELSLARPLVTGSLPQVLSEREMIPDPQRPNRFLYLQTNATRELTGQCIANAMPFGCVASIYDPPGNRLARNYYRRPGSHFQDVALTKRISLRERLQLQIRAEFYNVFNHANLELMPADAYSVSRFGSSFPSILVRYGGPPRHVVLATNVIF